MGQNGAEGKPLYSNVTDEERCERAPYDKGQGKGEPYQKII